MAHDAAFESKVKLYIYRSCEGLRLEGRKGREGGGLVFFWKKKGRGNRLSEEDW